MKFEQAREKVSFVVSLANLLATLAVFVWLAGYKLAAVETVQAAHASEIGQHNVALLRMDTEGPAAARREIDAIKVRVDKLDDVQIRLGEIQTDLRWIKETMRRNP